MLAVMDIIVTSRLQSLLRHQVTALDSLQGVSATTPWTQQKLDSGIQCYLCKQFGHKQWQCKLSRAKGQEEARGPINLTSGQEYQHRVANMTEGEPTASQKDIQITELESALDKANVTINSLSSSQPMVPDLPWAQR